MLRICEGVSFGSNFCISLFLLIKYILRPQATLTNTKILVWSGILWLYAILTVSSIYSLAGAMNKLDIANCHIGHSEGIKRLFVSQLAIVASNIGPAIVTTVMYGILYVKTRKYQNASQYRKYKTLRVMVILFAIFLVSWLPAYVFNLTDTTLQSPLYLLCFIYHSNFICVAVNPIYYAYCFKGLLPRWKLTGEVHPFIQINVIPVNGNAVFPS